MNLTQANGAELLSLLEKVEAALKLSTKPSKAAIVRSMAEAGWCSPKSSGTEKTLVNRAKALGLTLPPTLAQVMGEGNGSQSSTPSPTSRPSKSSVPDVEPPTQSSDGIHVAFIGSLSFAKVDQQGTAKLSFSDGTAAQFSGCAVDAFRSSCTLLELSGSSC